MRRAPEIERGSAEPPNAARLTQDRLEFTDVQRFFRCARNRLAGSEHRGFHRRASGNPQPFVPHERAIAFFSAERFIFHRIVNKTGGPAGHIHIVHFMFKQLFYSKTIKFPD